MLDGVDAAPFHVALLRGRAGERGEALPSVGGDPGQDDRAEQLVRRCSEPAPLNFEIVIPAAAMCPGHRLRDAVTEGTEPGEKAHALTVGVRAPAVARHRSAHGVEDAGDLLVAS
ncbi:hypothetical protein [Streptomyces sp. NPDC047014]|uniref:hypothetical protein n=1 Tax=Streptomyces sp. NPDC047014 TaxID=3155736 RepID=UPI0033D007C2